MDYFMIYIIIKMLFALFLEAKLYKINKIMKVLIRKSKFGSSVKILLKTT